MFYDDGIFLETEEDIQVFLEELVAYKELEKESFCFDGVTVENNGEFKYGNENAYLQMDIGEVRELLELERRECESGTFSMPENYDKLKVRAARLRKARKQKKKTLNLNKIINKDIKDENGLTYKRHSNKLKEIQKKKNKLKNKELRSKKDLSSTSRAIYKKV